MIGTLTPGSASALLAHEIEAHHRLPPAGCLDDGSGFLQARLSGSVQAELTWQGDALECSGGARPGDEGLRLRFSHHDASLGTLVIVLGMPAIAGTSARDLPV